MLTTKFSKFKLNKPVIYLKDEQTPNQPISHVNVIKDLKAFFEDNFKDFFCVYCDRKSNLRDRHVCCRPNMCNSCWKPSLLEDTQVSNNDKFIFCKPEEGYSFTCEKCNRVCVSDQCKIDHKDNCRKRWKCPNCGKIESTSKGNTTLESMAKNHKCNHKKCYICKENYLNKEDHFCKMHNEFGQKKWPRTVLAIQKENSIVIKREDEHYEKFAHYELRSNCESESTVSMEKYLPPEMGNHAVKIQRLSKRFNVHKIDYEMEIKWDSENLIHKFLRDILTLKKYENSTILFLSENEPYCLNVLLRECLNLGIKPSHKRKKSQVISITFRQPGIKILDPTNFFGSDILNEKDMSNVFAIMMSFLKETFQLQTRLWNSLSREEKAKFYEKTSDYMPYIHCFGTNILTITTFFYKTFKFFFHLDNDFLALVNEKGIYTRSSNAEILFVQFEMFKRRNQNLTYFSSLDEKNQKNLDGCFPDLYIEETQEAFFFHGN